MKPHTLKRPELAISSKASIIISKDQQGLVRPADLLVRLQHGGRVHTWNKTESSAEAQPALCVYALRNVEQEQYAKRKL